MSYDRELKNIFALEDELACSIAQALAPRLGARAPAALVRPTTASSAAHDDYLKGRYLWNQRTRESLRKAISFFQQAIAEDPSYALAYAGLADSYSLLIQYGASTAAEQLPKAKGAARRALELDGTLAEAHASLGLVGHYEYDWGTAEQEYRRASELDPRYAAPHHWYAVLLGERGNAETGAPCTTPTSSSTKNAASPRLSIALAPASVRRMMALRLDRENVPVLVVKKIPESPAATSATIGWPPSNTSSVVPFDATRTIELSIAAYAFSGSPETARIAAGARRISVRVPTLS